MSVRSGGWMKRLGLLGVVFFATKGLIWLALMGGVASMGAGWFSLR